MALGHEPAALEPDGARVPAHELERLLCGPAAGTALSRLRVPAADAWIMRLPGLGSLSDHGDEPAPAAETRPLRICIATEQIAGPIRNGGIGNTYASLALMLAEQGFDVTALYLRGAMVETETIEHWIAHYAARGVKLVPVPDQAGAERLRTGADRWLHGSYNMMRYLLDHPMDVVHVSEWRGSAYFSLLAKRQGLGLDETLFIVKTSSPWMWNRLYGAHTIEKLDDLAKIPAERHSVELADMVIGGSLHLLRWMASQGYAIPRERAFVQPNVLTLDTIRPLIRSRDVQPGSRMPIDEFVFFGRLEPRKGLFLFCQTIRRLIRRGVTLPPRITFLGKPGGRLPSHPDLEAPDALRIVTRDWPTEVTILTGYQQFHAVSYLLGGRRLAVMPSIIENSSMAIYEAAICGIPFVASDVGGNAELIAEVDHARVLCMPHPASLGEKLEEALADGGYVARSSFDNDANLATWQRFHRQLGGPLRAELLARSAASVPARAANAGGGVSACIYFTGDERALERTLASLAAQTVAPLEVLVGVDAESGAGFDRAGALLEHHGFAPRALEAYDLDAGAGFNLLAEASTAEYCHFLCEGATLVPEALATLGQIAGRGEGDVLAYLHRVEPSRELRCVTLGGTSEHFFRDDMRELPLFARREAFLGLGGFTADTRVIGYDHEFAAKAMLAGLRCRTAMAELGAIQDRDPEAMRRQGYDLAGARFRAIRPMLADAPLAMRDLLLFARGATTRGAGQGRGRHFAAASSRAERKQGMDGAHDDASSAVPRLPTETAPPHPPAPPASLPRRSAPLDTIHLAAPNAPGARSTPGLSAELAALLAEQALRGDGAVAGQLLGLYQGRLYGWAIDLRDVSRTVAVELVAAEIASVHRARGRFAAHVALPPEAMRHGFIIDLPEAYRHSREGIELSLTIADSPVVLATGIAVPPDASLASLGIDGACEANEEGALSGWARYVREPTRRVDIAAYADGAFLARFQTGSAPRANGPGQAFHFALPDRLRAAGKVEIALIVAEAGILLPGSPVTVDGGRVRPSGANTMWRNLWRGRK